MTRLGVIEGEVMTYLEARGTTGLRQVIRELDWPMRQVVMAVGSLIRRGLVLGVQRDLELLLEPLTLHESA